MHYFRIYNLVRIGNLCRFYPRKNTIFVPFQDVFLIRNNHNKTSYNILFNKSLGFARINNMKSLKKHILVVDDEEEIRFLLETKFFKLGYQVSTAATGMQAMQKVKSGTHYDLVICDLKMPRMNGVEFFLKMVEILPEAKFIMITGQPEKDKLVGAVKSGIANIMLKPVRHVDIVEKINSLIGTPDREPAA